MSNTMFKISNISGGGDGNQWIWISGEYSFEEPDEFVALMKAYESEVNGKIFEVSDMCQYSISNDPLKLIFQWDDNFGINIIVPRRMNISHVTSVIQSLLDKLNEKEVAFQEKFE